MMYKKLLVSSLLASVSSLDCTASKCLCFGSDQPQDPTFTAPRRGPEPQQGVYTELLGVPLTERPLQNRSAAYENPALNLIPNARTGAPLLDNPPLYSRYTEIGDAPPPYTPFAEFNVLNSTVNVTMGDTQRETLSCSNKAKVMGSVMGGVALGSLIAGGLVHLLSNKTGVIPNSLSSTTGVTFAPFSMTDDPRPYPKSSVAHFSSAWNEAGVLRPELREGFFKHAIEKRYIYGYQISRIEEVSQELRQELWLQECLSLVASPQQKEGYWSSRQSLQVFFQGQERTGLLQAVWRRINPDKALPNEVSLETRVMDALLSRDSKLNGFFHKGELGWYVNGGHTNFFRLSSTVTPSPRQKRRAQSPDERRQQKVERRQRQADLAYEKSWAGAALSVGGAFKDSFNSGRNWLKDSWSWFNDLGVR